MVYITGDIHGQVEGVRTMINSHNITPNDIFVLLGDVGLNYYGNKRGDRSRKRKLDAYEIPILCIHGNHEARPESLIIYREASWHGSTVYVEEEYPNLRFAKDGEVYDLEGTKAIAIGGAYSVDKWYRLQNGLHWFQDEQPSDAIKARAEVNLDRIGWQVDVVLSHTCPYQYLPREAFFPGVDQSLVDNRTEQWLDTIEKRLDYKLWFCGHFHIEKRIDKMRFLYRSTLCLNEELGLSAGYDEFEKALALEEPNTVTYAAMEEAEKMDKPGKSYVRVKDFISALEE